MWRIGIVALGFSTALGLGLAGGMNVHRLVNLDETATWLQQTGGMLHSGFEAARHEIGSRIANFTTKSVSVTQASQEATSARPNDGEALERAVADLAQRMDQVRASDGASARDLGTGIERVRSLTEQNHREVITKLAQLAERVERIERQAVAIATPPAVQPVVQPAPKSPPPKSVTTSVAKPRQKSVSNPKVTVTLKPNPTIAKPAMHGMDEQGVANWTVRSVFNDTAVLEGPQGRIAVGPGDTIPGLGQIHAIMRSGGRWVVATSKGVITARKRVPYPEASADEW